MGCPEHAPKPRPARLSQPWRKTTPASLAKPTASRILLEQKQASGSMPSAHNGLPAGDHRMGQAKLSPRSV